MPTLTVYDAAGAAFAGAIVAIIVYHLAAVRPGLRRIESRLQTQDGLIGGAAGGAADRLAALEAICRDSGRELGRVSARLDEIERLARVDLSGCGFVRYDAFDDTGSNLSYALALLNRAGDGVVISSIYSRNDTRTYGKAVTAFKPAANASDEELEAIALARKSSTTT